MPARGASKVSPSAKATTNTTVVPKPAGVDGGIISTTREQSPRKRSKIYDDDRIEADIRAVYPNWVPVDPSLLVEHGLAGSPSGSTSSPPSSSGHKHGHNAQANSNNNHLNDVSGLRPDSLSGGGGSPVQTAPLPAPLPSKAQMSGKGRGRGRGPNEAKNNSKNDTTPQGRAMMSLRNTEHDIPEIAEGPYAVFLDRHGQRPEHFPAVMLKRLEHERQKRSVPPALPATPDSLPSPPEGSENRNTGVTTTSHIHSNDKGNGNGNRNGDGNGKSYVWVVTHTQQGGYDRFRPVQRGIPDSSGAGSGVRFHGVFSTLGDANVKAMEVFQKLYRDFMLCPRGAGGLGSSLGFGLLGGSDNSLGFVEMSGDGHYNSYNDYSNGKDNGNNDSNSDTAADGPNSSSSPFFESHPVLQEDAEGASWWVDDWGCLSLRAMNWGTGDSRIFVARQEFNR
jgi:hypothetical protein